MIRPGAESIDLSPLSALAPQLATTIASVASDIALVVDDQGVIRNVAVGSGQPLTQAEQWVGRHWVDTVTAETRRKIEQLLQEAAEGGLSGRREVNLVAPGGADIPIAFSAIRLGRTGPVLAVGRDLRAIAAIQQRFMQAQSDMERDYWKRRQTEARYRTLFEVATDAVFVVDAESLNIVDANAAAVKLYDLAPDQLVGKRATVGLDGASRGPVEHLLVSARSSGRPAEIRARLAGKRATSRISATPFRADGTMMLLMRAAAADEVQTVAAGDHWAALVERTPDSIVVCDSGGRVRIANPAFAALVGAGSEEALRGRALSSWVTPAGLTLDALLDQVRLHGIVAPMAASLRTPAAAEAVELSAMLLPEGEQESIGVVLRLAQARPAVLASGLTTALAQISSQLGLASLPTLLQEVSRLAERHLLASALARSDGDHASAAQMLGVTLADFSARLAAQQLQA